MGDSDGTTDVSKGTALVTGASRGIGYELARLFAGTGYDVVLTARSEEDLREAADYFEERFGVEATVLPADLSDPEAPRELYEECNERGLEVTALVNNAGFGTSGTFVDTDLEAELDLIRVNVTALTHLTKLFGREMADRGDGKVLNVASSASFAPGPKMAVYHASKAYVRSFSEAIAEELRPEGVTVTCLCPGPVETDFRERAGTEDKRLNVIQRVGPGLFERDARDVARAGYRGLTKGDAVVVPALPLRIALSTTRLLPRSVVRKLTGFLNG